MTAGRWNGRSQPCSGAWDCRRKACCTVGDRATRIGAGRRLTGHIAKARFVELDGADHWFFAGDQQPLLASIRQFVGSLAAS